MKDILVGTDLMEEQLVWTWLAAPLSVESAGVSAVSRGRRCSGRCRWRSRGCRSLELWVIINLTLCSSLRILTAPHLELTSLRIQGVIIKVHPAGDCDPDPELVSDRLVLVDPHPGHFLQHSLPAKGVEAVDLQLWIPDVFQNFRRLVHFLDIKWL